MRRDWCDLAKDAGTYVLDSILSNKKRDTVLEEIHSYLTGKIFEVKVTSLSNKCQGKTMVNMRESRGICRN